MDILKSTRDNNAHHLRIRIENLERMGGVPRHRTIISLREQSCLLLMLFILLRPQLEPALEVEEVLVVRLVDMRQNTQRATVGSIGAHQRECMAG